MPVVDHNAPQVIQTAKTEHETAFFAIFLLSKLFNLAPENTGNEGISEVQLDPTFNGTCPRQISACYTYVIFLRY